MSSVWLPRSPAAIVASEPTANHTTTGYFTYALSPLGSQTPIPQKLGVFRGKAASGHTAIHELQHGAEV